MPSGEQIVTQTIASFIALAIFTFIGWAFNSLSDERIYERDYVRYSPPKMYPTPPGIPSPQTILSPPPQTIIFQQPSPQIQTAPVAVVHPQDVSELTAKDNSTSASEICDEPDNTPVLKDNDVGGYQLITQQFRNQSSNRS